MRGIREKSGICSLNGVITLSDTFKWLYGAVMGDLDLRTENKSGVMSRV